VPKEISRRRDASTREKRLDALRLGLTRLEQALKPYPLVNRHGLPDYVFLQFAADVFEQSGATLLVASGPAPRAAVANARAAFESSADMLALVAEPTLYDEMGAFVRVCELLAQEDLRRLRKEASRVVGSPAPEGEPEAIEEVVRREGQAWDVDQPGVLEMYERVLIQARSDGRWRRHWSGLGNYNEVLKYIERKHGADPGFKEVGAMWYRAATHGSHPGPRTGTRSVEWTPSGRLAVGPKVGDDALPLLVANYACEHALEALRVRQALSPRASSYRRWVHFWVQTVGL
jgi:hypothetical protein